VEFRAKDKRCKRDHTEGERERESSASRGRCYLWWKEMLHFFRWVMLTGTQGFSSVDLQCRLRARLIFFFFQRQMGERESLDDASLLDKEDCWEFNYLPHVTCAHWCVGPTRMGTTRKWPAYFILGVPVKLIHSLQHETLFAYKIWTLKSNLI
jgi:hypothetical protein